jgi:hypothetical protein
MPDTTLHFEWEGLLRFDEIHDKTSNDDYGLYQIYAHHLVYGPGALVYIGKAEDQSFATRLNQHWMNWAKPEDSPLVRLGRMDKRDYRDDADWASLLAAAEPLTVFWHTPAYTSHFILDYPDHALRMRILNTGKRGGLLPEYSTDWKPVRPDDSAPE